MSHRWNNWFSFGGSSGTDNPGDKPDREEMERELESLRESVEQLENEKETLRSRLEQAERTSVTPEMIFSSIGEAVATANDSLAGVEYRVDALEVSLKSRVTIGEEGIRLVIDEDETTSPIEDNRISDFRFHVAKRESEFDPIAEGASHFEEVPDVREFSVERARRLLTDIGFDVAVQYDPDEEPTGIVVAQDPPPYVVGPQGETVRISVGGAPPGDAGE